jgi:hypothetical protein
MKFRISFGSMSSGPNCHGGDPRYALLSRGPAGIYLRGAHHARRRTGLDGPLPSCQHRQSFLCFCLCPRGSRTLLRLVQKPADRPVIRRGDPTGVHDSHSLSRVLPCHRANEPMGCYRDHQHTRCPPLTGWGSNRTCLRGVFSLERHT